MIINDQQIVDAVNANEISIIPFEPRQVQPATYDLRVGKYGATTSLKKKIDIESNGFLNIEPGDFAVVEVLEVIKLSPQFTARFGLRSKYARKGLIATTGVQIDPGYEGRLIIGLTNLTPKTITLAFKDDFVTVEFHKLESPAKEPYCGPYQQKMGIGAEEIEFIAESDGMALSEMLNTLRVLSRNVGELSKDMGTFTAQFNNVSSQIGSVKWFLGIFIGFVSLIVAVLAIVLALK